MSRIPIGKEGVDQGRIGRFQLSIRATIVVSVVLALGATRAGGEGSVLAIELLLVGAALVCAIVPDNHLGLALIGALGANWLVAVDDSTTPWVIAVAVLVAIFHTAMAAAGVAPIGASWTPAMARRWARRLGPVAAASLPTWALAAGLEGADLPRSPALVTAALLVLAAGATWVRQRSLDQRSPR
jgi:hypothetical protein